jgi:hypothetical protein
LQVTVQLTNPIPFRHASYFSPNPAIGSSGAPDSEKTSCRIRAPAFIPRTKKIHMIKSLLTVLTIAILGAVSADAKTFKLPNEDFAIASIDVPDSWKPKEAENGVFGQSADDAVYLSVVAVGSEKGMSAEIDDTFEMLKTHKVELDDSTKKENKFKIGALDATELLYQGKDQDGPAAVSIVFVPIKDKLIIMTYWVTTAKEKEHLKEVGTIVNSLKPTS